MTNTRQRHPVLRFALYALVGIALIWAVLVAVSIVVHVVLPWVILVTAVLCLGWGVRLLFHRRRA